MLNEKVRFLCVNTSESVHPDKKQNIPMGKVASRYTVLVYLMPVVFLRGKYGENI